jgi:hypothetical protein
LSCTPGCCATPREHYRSLTTTVGLDTDVAHFTEKRLDEYDDAVRQGVQPATTKLYDIRAAMRQSDKTGEAFQG